MERVQRCHELVEFVPHLVLGCQDDTSANFLAPEFSTIYVSMLEIEMDGSKSGTCTDCTYTFELPASHTGRYTLKELVNLDMGIPLQPIDSSDWEGTTRNSFSFDSSQVSLGDSYYCWEFGINYPNPDYKHHSRRNNDW